eukprot:SAG31_NODE_12584_length_931_cov_1.069712_1_plen_117_part_10
MLSGGGGALDPVLSALNGISIDDLELGMTASASTGGSMGFELGVAGTISLGIEGMACDPNNDCSCASGATNSDYIQCVAVLVASPRVFAQYTMETEGGRRRLLTLREQHDVRTTKVG